MDAMQIIFIIVAAVTLGAAIMVVSARSLVHSALWLVLSLFGVAVLYVLLNAGFFAVAQVLIYIGAIAILFIFAVMLTRQVAKDSRPQLNGNWWLALLIGGGFFAVLLMLFSKWGSFQTLPQALADEGGVLPALGEALVTTYLLPFEIASVLLVAALIGAIYVSWPKR